MNNGGNAEDGWKAQYECLNCGLPVAEWDNGVWVHIRMGQKECYMTGFVGEKMQHASPEGHPLFITTGI